MNKLKTLLTLVIMISCSVFAFAQKDSRYDAGMNLPFNEKAGDVNPQTGNITISAGDVTLPGRAGFDFSFGRIWALNQSNVFNMYRDPNDGRNRLSSETIEKYNKIGVGWNSNLPYIYSDLSSGEEIISLFFGGSVYELDSSGIGIYNPNKSNILGYDLLDIRVYQDSGVAYSDMSSDLTGVQNKYQINDKPADRSKYILYMKNNEKYYFRPDGRVMMQQDRTGLGRIWYFYGTPEATNNNSSLLLVIDSIGRYIRFTYDANGNLNRIEWDVEIGIKNVDSTRVRSRVTKSVNYTYESSEKFTEVASLRTNVIGYSTPFILTGMTDPMGNVTKYDYKAGTIDFTYDSSRSISKNAYVLMTGISSIYTEDGKYKNKRSFEYEIPAKGLYTKWFYSGFMQYYKISREYYLDRHGNTLNNTSYIYHDNNEAGNFNQYTAVIQRGNVKTTYTYSLNDEKNKNQILDTLLVESLDGFKQLSDYVYNSDRTKSLEEVYKQGTFVYREKFQYDSKGNLKRHEDRAGLVTITEYDDKFSIPVKISKLVTVEGIQKSYDAELKINSLGQVLKEIIYLENPNGTKRAVEMTVNTYDIYGNVTEKTDALKNITHFVYDSVVHCFPIKIWQEVSIDSWASGTVHDNWKMGPTGSKKVIIRSWKVFNSDGSIWLELDNEGYAKEHYYDLLGQEVEIINPDLDDVKGFAQPLDVGNIGNDFDNFLTSSFYPEFLASRVNNPGARMQIDYQNDYVRTEADIDKARGEAKITGKQGNGTGLVEEEIEYGVNGFEYSVRKMEYDSQGRMITLTDPDASDDSVPIIVSGSTYERHDKTWVVKYDDVGRKTKVLYPDINTGKTDIKQTSYNDAENSITTIDPEGRKVYQRSDWNGNIVEIKAYGSSLTKPEEMQAYTYQYDELKRKVRFTDAKSIVTGYKYDERNLLIEQNYGEESGSDFLSYDDNGKLIKKTDRKMQVITFTYDELGRNTKAVHYKSGNDYTAGKIDQTVSLVYDNRGNAVRVSNGNLIEHYIYDFGNRAIKLDRRLKDAGMRTTVAGIYGGDADSQTFGFEYTYNDAGMVKEMKYPDGSIHRFNYDGVLGRLISLDEGANAGSISPFVTSLSYNKSGVVTRMNYSNLTYQQWDFDNRKRIKEIKISSASELIEDLKYKLNGDGDILSINENEYSYDGFDRIIGAKTLIPGNVDRLKFVKKYFGTARNGDLIDGVGYNVLADLNFDGLIDGADHMTASMDSTDAIYDKETFSYDKNGNRTGLSQNGDNYTYEYGIQNRLLKVYKQTKGASTKKTYIEYAYDANGNTTKRTIYKDDNKKEITDFAYDTMNRLVESVMNAKSTKYYYDNAGNRFIKKDEKGTTLYLRHGQIVVAMDIEIMDDSTADRGKINRYVLSGDLLAGRITTTVKLDGSRVTQKSWYHLDHLNSTKCVTDANAKIEVKYEYRAFGEQLKRLGVSGEEVGDKARYSYGGKELDDETNLYYFNARFYDATTGRFINVDLIQDGTNWYVYCNNNPLSFKDPTGLMDIKGFTGTGGLSFEVPDLLALGRNAYKYVTNQFDNVKTFFNTEDESKFKPKIINDYENVKQLTVAAGIYINPNVEKNSLEFGVYASAGKGQTMLPQGGLNVDLSGSFTNADNISGKSKSVTGTVGPLSAGGQFNSKGELTTISVSGSTKYSLPIPINFGSYKTDTVRAGLEIKNLDKLLKDGPKSLKVEPVAK